MTLAETILSNDLAVASLSIILLVLVAYLREVGPREALVGELVRGFVWRALDPVLRARGRPLTRDKTGSDEYIATVDCSLLALLRALWNYGFRWNPLSTKKYRIADGEKQWAVFSAVYRDSVIDDVQQHVYVFRSDAGLEIWGHREGSVTTPRDHVGGDEQVAGDPEGHVQAALEEAGLNFRSGGNNRSS